MRKKRKERARAEEAAAIAADLAIPEVQEALEAERIVAAMEAAQRAEAEAAAMEAAAEAAALAEATAGEGAVGEEGSEVGEELTQDRITSIVESYLFASDKPLTAPDVHKLFGKQAVAREQVQIALDSLVEAYQERGIVVHVVAGGYQLRTHPANSSWVQKLVAGKPVRLSRAQLETLAICAYRQPITRPEIDEIRGVDSGGTLRVLLDRSLIRILGKKEEPGRPLLYGTTKDFLEFFNLGDLGELPTLREYSELSEDSMAEVKKLGLNLDDLARSAKVEVADDDGDDEGGDGSGGDSGGQGGGAELASDEAGDADAGAEPMAADAADEGRDELAAATDAAEHDGGDAMDLADDEAMDLADDEVMDLADDEVMDLADDALAQAEDGDGVVAAPMVAEGSGEHHAAEAAMDAAEDRGEDEAASDPDEEPSVEPLLADEPSSDEPEPSAEA